MRNILKFSVFSALFLIPGFAFANVSFSEIMHDLKTGGDTDREWVEVFNGGSSSVDISDWRFFESDTNHKMTTSSDGVLSPDEYAVIVSDEEKFKIDNPSYSGKIFQSSFSLSNTGEKLELRTAALATVDSVLFSSSMGASGDGNSLQKINGVWKAGSPTPGMLNETVSEENPQEETPSNSQRSSDPASTSLNSSTSQTSSFFTLPVPYHISAYAGESRTVVVGSRVFLNGEVRGGSSESFPYAKYSWNFGDGETGEGKTIEHIYYYPGEYVVTLGVKNGAYTADTEVVITVVPVNVVILKVGTDDVFVEIKNNSKNEVDLSGWVLKHGEISFTFPKGTFLRAGKSITVPSRITKFVVTGTETSTSLSYADGTIVSVFGEIKKVENVARAAVSKTVAAVIHTVSKNNVLPASFETSQTVPDEEEIATGTQLASVSELPLEKGTNDNGMFWGLVGVSLVVLIAIYAVLESQQKGFPVREKGKSEAEKYTILDIES
jgi:hypothetical protein